MKDPQPTRIYKPAPPHPKPRNNASLPYKAPTVLQFKRNRRSTMFGNGATNLRQRRRYRSKRSATQTRSGRLQQDTTEATCRPFHAKHRTRWTTSASVVAEFRRAFQFLVRPRGGGREGRYFERAIHKPHARKLPITLTSPRRQQKRTKSVPRKDNGLTVAESLCSPLTMN